MTRYDKYEPFVGGFRAELAVDFPAESVDQLLGVSLNANGQVVVGRGSTDEVQSIGITGNPTGGSFKLTLNGSQTGPIPYNATATTVKTALASLANVHPLDINVTGGPLPGTPVVVRFGGKFSGQNVPQMTAQGSLTGGSSPAVAVSTTTAGGSALTADTDSGMVGVLVLTKARKAGEVVDVMTSGECVEFKLPGGAAANPGTRYYMEADGTVTDEDADAVMVVGWTAERDRLIVRTERMA